MGDRLERVGWATARRAYLSLDQQEFDADRKAHTLAWEIRRRLEGRLSDDPEITARALRYYDRELIEPLSAALRTLVDGQRWSRVFEQNFRVDKWNLCRG
jgi:hypothetical protein